MLLVCLRKIRHSKHRSRKCLLLGLDISVFTTYLFV
ncbi:unnamed protein product [Brugia timori]|uniref:Uncharacterized protein n=1 Tax=Brugia timori TaxID=42155 RepID=A0A0R3Q698_9BILA|nr:unnamed protein product [Brugia timori]